MMVVYVVVSSIGAVSRFALERWSVARFGASAPWGTFAANLGGSLFLGLAMGQPESSTQLVAAQAFCGAFTTFGGFIAQSYSGIRNRENAAWGWPYLAFTIFGSLAAAGLGMQIAGAI